MEAPKWQEDPELIKAARTALDRDVGWGPYLPTSSDEEANRRIRHNEPTVFAVGLRRADGEVAFWRSYVVLPEPQKPEPSISPSVTVSPSTAPRSRTSGIRHAFWVFLRDGPLARLLAYAGWILFVILVVKLALPEVPAPPPPPIEHLARVEPQPVLQIYDSAIRAAFGDCGDPCVVRDNRGGTVATFAYAAEGLLAGARKGLIIDGPCASACSFAADLARKVTCITPRAIFGFHRTSEERDLPYSEAIVAKIRDAEAKSPEIVLPGGGLFPTNSSHKLIWILSETALEFWPSCTSADFIRRLHYVDPQ
jgi:hypothetical protein